MASFAAENETCDYLFKILLIGDTGVGKSSLLSQFVDNNMDIPITVGADFKYRVVTTAGKRIKLQIWDTAGQERFRTITSSYYRGSQGVMLMYDIKDRVSFNNIQHWFGELDRYASDKVCKMLIGNQCDLGDRRVVEYEEGVSLAKTLGVPFFETSARDRTNVETAFVTMSKTIYETLSGQKRPATPGGMGSGLGLTPSEGREEGQSSGCCS